MPSSAGELIFVVALSVLAWKACVYEMEKVSPRRARVLACEVLGALLLLAGGVLARAHILSQRTGLTMLLVVILSTSLGIGVVSFCPKWARVFLYYSALLLACLGTLLEAGKSGPHPGSSRKHMLHEVGLAVMDFHEANGNYPQSLGTLVVSGFLDRAALEAEDGRWICYWPPREDSRAAEIVAYYWPPEDGRTEVLHVDTGVSLAEVQPGKGLVNPRTDVVSWGPEH